MRFTLDEVGADTYQIDIAAVRTQVEQVTPERQQLSSVVENLVLIDAHLILGDFHAPLLDCSFEESHGFILEILL